MYNYRGRFNPLKSKLVKEIKHIQSFHEKVYLPITAMANTVYKRTRNGELISERYYDENGQVYLDIDYTNHGNPKMHKIVPHIHKWIKDGQGNLIRQQGEKFQ